MQLENNLQMTTDFEYLLSAKCIQKKKESIKRQGDILSVAVL